MITVYDYFLGWLISDDVDKINNDNYTTAKLNSGILDSIYFSKGNFNLKKYYIQINQILIEI